MARVSVVTISYNQGQFLEKAIRSVLAQTEIDFEYILVDAGSTDCSKTIIEKYFNRISFVINEPDHGPADGLNKGFDHATGDVFCYLNADDVLLPGALKRAVWHLTKSGGPDVVCGHGFAIDQNGNVLRRMWSDPFSPLRQAYGAAIQIQPSTFMKAECFRKIGGFNIQNRSNWDGELLLDLFYSGATIEVVNEFLSSYRLHASSITGSGSEAAKIKVWERIRFNRIMQRQPNLIDQLLRIIFKIERQFRNPPAFFERLCKGPIYKRRGL